MRVQLRELILAGALLAASGGCGVATEVIPLPTTATNPGQRPSWNQIPLPDDYGDVPAEALGYSISLAQTTLNTATQDISAKTYFSPSIWFFGTWVKSNLSASGALDGSASTGSWNPPEYYYVSNSDSHATFSSGIQWTGDAHCATHVSANTTHYVKYTLVLVWLHTISATSSADSNHWDRSNFCYDAAPPSSMTVGQATVTVRTNCGSSPHVGVTTMSDPDTAHVVQAWATGSDIQIQPLAAGRAMLDVTCSDSYGNGGQFFDITVGSATPPPDVYSQDSMGNPSCPPEDTYMWFHDAGSGYQYMGDVCIQDGMITLLSRTNGNGLATAADLSPANATSATVTLVSVPTLPGSRTHAQVLRRTRLYPHQLILLDRGATADDLTAALAALGALRAVDGGVIAEDQSVAASANLANIPSAKPYRRASQTILTALRQTLERKMIPGIGKYQSVGLALGEIPRIRH